VITEVSGTMPVGRRVQAEDGIHQRRLAAIEAAGNDEVEAIFREADKQVLQPIVQRTAAISQFVRHDPLEKLCYLELRPFVFAKVHG
jgi:hypothetical protein